jgi:Flp pilus assembly protein TadG
MARLIRWLRRNQKGQDLIEFAISVMLLMGLAAGIADFGLAFQNYIIITNASREGARIAARAPCRASDGTQRTNYRAQIVNAALREAAGGNVTIVAGDITISPDPVGTGCAMAGGPVSVTVTHRYNMMMADLVGANSVNLRARTQMVFYGAD